MPKRTDRNQQEIVNALRSVGASVLDLHMVGRGCPDILVGYRGLNILMEIKTGNASLTGAEPKWHKEWRGNVYIVRTVNEAFALLESFL